MKTEVAAPLKKLPWITSLSHSWIALEMIYSGILRFIYWIHNLSNKIYSVWKWAPEVTKEVTLKGLIDRVQQVYQISVTLLRETLT